MGTIEAIVFYAILGVVALFAILVGRGNSKKEK
jgi:hypothetical protein